MFEKLFEEAEDFFPPQPTQPPDLLEGGVDIDGGKEGEEYEPLGGGVQPGGVMTKGSLPEGVIIWLKLVSLYYYMERERKIDTSKSKIF